MFLYKEQLHLFEVYHGLFLCQLGLYRNVVLNIVLIAIEV